MPPKEEHIGLKPCAARCFPQAFLADVGTCRDAIECAFDMLRPATLAEQAVEVRDHLGVCLG
jgi:hypothetical protein